MPIPQAEAPAQAVSQQAHSLGSSPAGVRREIRPVRVVLLNGAAEKSDGDLRIARLLANTALQVEFTILRDQHAAERDISPHLLHFYRTFAEVQARSYDAVVAVGHELDGGRRPGQGGDDELGAVIAWSRRQGHAGLFLGGTAVAALNLGYGLQLRRLPARASGIVRHRVVAPREPLLRGHDLEAWIPVLGGHGLDRGDLPPGGTLTSLVESAAAGIHVLRDAARRHTFVLNDVSADADAIAQRLKEGSAERASGPGSGTVRIQRGWRSHAQLLFANWLTAEVRRLPAPTTPSHEAHGDSRITPALGTDGGG
jgi:homoserine O-succinyltransferase